MDDLFGSTRYRLECRECMREDFDDIMEIPDDWLNVEPIPEDDEMNYSVFSWATHYGLCPDCAGKKKNEVAEKLT